MKKKGRKKKKKKAVAADEDSSDSDIEPKKKSRLRRRRAGSFIPSSHDSDDDARRNRKRKKKRSRSRATTATTEDSSVFDESVRESGKVTSEDDEDETEKTREITEGDLVQRMKGMIAYMFEHEHDDMEWTKWNSAPLYHFLRKEHVVFVIAFVVKVEESTEPLPGVFKNLAKYFVPNRQGKSLVTLNAMIPGLTADLFYFVKSNQVKVNGYNFEDVVVYGNCPAAGHVRSLTEILSLWTPLLTHEDCLAEGVKDEVFADLNTLAIKSNNAVNLGENGELLLYFPLEIRGDRPGTVLSKDKSFCSRLEETITCWLTSFQQLLTFREPNKGLNPDPLDEIKFWERRSQNFSTLLSQIRTKQMKRVLRVLHLSNSPFIPQLLSMYFKLKNAFNEASSNSYYLQTLKEPCSNTFKCKFREVPVQIQKYLWLVIAISRNAPFYKCKAKPTGLLIKFSNFLITQITARIDTVQLFQGNLIQKTERKVKNFLKVLNWWKEIYVMTQKTFSSREEWIFDYEPIFCHVDAMIRRLKDTLEICEVRLVFCNVPGYPGLKGPYLTSVMMNVKKILDSKFESMVGLSDIIYNVHNPEWHVQMKSFSDTVHSVEVIVHNVMDEVFDQLANLQDRLELIHAFRAFSCRSSLLRQVDKLSIKVFEHFEAELLFLRQLFEKKIVPLPNTYSRLAGRGAWALYMKKRIDDRLLTLKQRGSCLANSGFADYVKSEAKALADAMGTFTLVTYEAWTKCLMKPMEYSEKLNVPVLTRKGIGGDKHLVHVNFHRLVYYHMEEAVIWQRLGMSVPHQINVHVYPNRDKIHDLLENASLIAKFYNQVVLQLSTHERLLFKDRIRPLDRKLYACLSNHTWVNSTEDLLLADEFLALSREVQRLINLYRQGNAKIVLICMKIIKSFRVVKIEPKSVYDPLEFKSSQNKMIQSQIHKIVNEYKKISEVIQETFKYFKSDTDEVKVQWGKYAGLIDECFAKALCTSLRESLKLLESHVCNNKHALFNVGVKLENGQLSFDPDLECLSDLILGTHDNVCDALHPLKLISQYLGMGDLKGKYVASKSFADALLADVEVMSIKSHMKFAINKCFSELSLFCDRFVIYRDLWELDKDEFMVKYERYQPDIDAYEKDMGKYFEISRVAKGIEDSASIGFLQLDCTTLKAQIHSESQVWFNMISQHLYLKSKSGLEKVYEFIGKCRAKLDVQVSSVDEQMRLFESLAEFKGEGTFIFSLIPVFSEQFELLESFQFNLEPEVKVKLEELDSMWRSHQKFIREVTKGIEKSHENLRNAFLDQADAFNLKVLQVVRSYESDGPFSCSGDTILDEGENAWNLALLYLEDMVVDVNRLKDREQELHKMLTMFGISRDKNQSLIEFDVEVQSLIGVWKEVKRWDIEWGAWKTTLLAHVNKGRLSEEVSKFIITFQQLSIDLERKCWPVIRETLEFMLKVQSSLELLEPLNNKSLEPRHWDRMSELVGSTVQPGALDFGTLVNLDLCRFAHEISEITGSSLKEAAIERTLCQIERYWVDVEFILKERNDMSFLYVELPHGLQDNLMDHIVSLSAMKISVFLGGLCEKIEYWTNLLQDIQEVVDKLVCVQDEFLNVEGLFRNEEVGKEMPSQAVKFRVCQGTWECILRAVSEYVRIVDTVQNVREMQQLLDDVHDQIGYLRLGLKGLADGKRMDNERLYFLQDHELIGMVGGGSRALEFICKMFGGVHACLSENGGGLKVQGVISEEGEKLWFETFVGTHMPPEFWLRDFERELKLALRNTLEETLLEDMSEDRKLAVPLQCWDTALRIEWTEQVSGALQGTTALDDLKKIRKRLSKKISFWVGILQGKNMDTCTRLKLENVLLSMMELKKVVQGLLETKCCDNNSFGWLQCLRVYRMQDDGDVRVCQGFGSWEYGYEYLGMWERIVRTPLTERCMLALTTALTFNYGALIHGSSGKTVTIKALANAMGRYCLDLSLSPEVETVSLGNYIKGAVATGAWLVLRNLNFLKLDLISSLMNKLEWICHVKTQGINKVLLDGMEVSVNRGCGFFGIIGKEQNGFEVDLTRRIMRPIQMATPDYVYILETRLFVHGFEDYVSLAKKINLIFQHAKEEVLQTQCQFSLAGMLAVVEKAAEFKKFFRKRISEVEAIIKAMQSIVSPSLTSEESVVYNSIIQRSFPAHTPLKEENLVLEEAIVHTIKRLGYKLNNALVRVCLRTYEVMKIYNCVVIVGSTFSGKSVVREVVKGAVASILGGVAIKEFVINPATFDNSQLFGNYSCKDGCWNDGVLTKILRNNVEGIQQWIVFDGAVGSWSDQWLCDLISGHVTLANLESLRVTDNKVSIFVETDELSQVSPAFLSKSGIIFVEKRNVWKLLVKAWLDDLSPSFIRSELSTYLLESLEKCLKFCHENLSQLKLQGDVGVISSYISMMESFIKMLEKSVHENPDKFCFMLKRINVFCITWSIFGVLPHDMQLKTTMFLKDVFEDSKLFPTRGTIFEYSYDDQKDQWVKWEELSKSMNDNGDISHFVHTSDTARCYQLINRLRTCTPVLLVGESDAGKTSLMKCLQRNLCPDSNASLVIKKTPTFSAYSIQSIINTRLERVSLFVSSPHRGKTLTLFIDDLNVSYDGEIGGQKKPDAFCEFVRHVMQNRMWFDEDTGNCVAISNLSFICSMSCRVVGSNPGATIPLISPRILSKCCVIYLPKPDEFKLRKIFTLILTHKLVNFPAHVRDLADDITIATLEVHKLVSASFPFECSKPLHGFDITAIGMVYEGLLRADRHTQDSRLSLVRLWFHESTRVYFDRLMDDDSRMKFTQIMNEQLLKHFELKTANLFPGNFSIFGNFMSAGNKFYEEIKDQGGIRNLINTVMGNGWWKKRSVVLSLDAIKEIAKIGRAISMEQQAHLINCGGGVGQGLRTLTLLVCHVYKYKMFLMDDKIEPINDMSTESFLKVLKSVYYTCGVESQSSCLILKNEHVNDGILYLLNLITSTIELPQLFSKSELVKIKSTITKAKESQKPTHYKGWTDNSEFHDYFREEVKRNLHVVLCFDNRNKDDFRQTMIDHKSLLKQMTVNWFKDPDDRSYLDIAHIYLANRRVGEPNGLPTPELFHQFHAIAQELGYQYAAGWLGYCGTLIMPTHLMDFIELYDRLLATNLTTIKSQVKTLKSALTNIENLRSRIGDLSEVAQKAHDKVLMSCKECDELSSIIKNQEEITSAQDTLVNNMSGELEVEEKEYEELAGNLREEWGEVVGDYETSMEILEDLCVEDLHHIRAYYTPPPIVSRVLDAVMIMFDRDQNWPEAKIQLGNKEFIRNVIEYDKTRVTLEKLHNLRKFVQNKEFTPEVVGKYSNGARILCSWVLALEKYARTYLTSIIPRNEKLEESQLSIEEKARAVELSTSKLHLLQENLKELKGVYKAKVELKDGREEEYRRSVDVLKRAEDVLSLVDKDVDDWNERLGQLDTSANDAAYHCFFASAFLTYLGCFNKCYREKLKGAWKSVVPINYKTWKLDGFLQRSHVGLMLRKEGFGGDNEYLVENCLVFEHTRGDVLVIDPECISDHVIQVNVTTEETGRSDTTRRNIVNMKQLDTEEVNGSVLSNHTMINFTLEGEELLDYIAQRIASKVDLNTMAKRSQLLKTALAEEASISSLKERIPCLIIQCGDNILDNPEFQESLHKWKSQLEVAQTHLTDETYVGISELDCRVKNLYYNVAEMYANLYSVLRLINKFPPSLRHFLGVLDTMIENCMKGGDNGSPRRRDVDVAHYLRTSVYFSLLRYLRKSMFRETAYLFGLLCCIRQMVGNSNSIELEQVRFLATIDLKEELDDNGDENSNEKKQKLPKNLESLEKFDRFNGIYNSVFHDDQNAWEVWMERGPQEELPSPFDKLNALEKLILACVLQPRHIFRLIENLTAQLHGEEFKEILFTQSLVDLKDMYDNVNMVVFNSKEVHPIVLLHQTNHHDPKPSVVALASTLKVKLYTLHVTKFNKQLGLNVLQEAMDKGLWVYFVNVHLFPNWVNKVVEKVKHPHSASFRVWLSTAPGDWLKQISGESFIIAIEPVENLDLSISRLLIKMTANNSSVVVEVKNLVYSLAVMHSVLVGRFNNEDLHVPVLHDSDFEICAAMIKLFATTTGEIEWWALHQMIEMQYSHVWKHLHFQQFVASIIHRLFCPEAVKHPQQQFRLPSSSSPNGGSNIVMQLPEQIQHDGDLTAIYKQQSSYSDPEMYGFDVRRDFEKSRTLEALRLLKSLQGRNVHILIAPSSQ